MQIDGANVIAGRRQYTMTDVAIMIWLHDELSNYCGGNGGGVILHVSIHTHTNARTIAHTPTPTSLYACYNIWCV